MKQKFQTLFQEVRLLMRSVPPLTFALFILSVFSMNLLANKSLNIPLNWLALDCGIIVSWVTFLCLDVLTRCFGPRAATIVSVIAIGVNLIACGIFFLASLIPGTWGAFYDFGGTMPEINAALDRTIGGTWYVVIGSAAAFFVSSVVNNFSNWGIGKLFKKRPDSFFAFACRTYLSTALGQFVDNLIFALLVSHFFFGWSLLQCFTCAATGMIAELLVEAVFSPAGYRIVRRWQTQGIGKEYLAYRAAQTSRGEQS